MIVLKFGGSSVADAEGIRRVCGIVEERMDLRPVVVVSALGGVTDLLLEATAAAGRGDLPGQEAAVAGIERRHRWALSGCLDDAGARHDAEMVLAETFEDIRQLLRSIRTLGETSLRAGDAVLACGELLSSRLLTSALAGAGLPAVWVDPREVVLTDGGHGSAVPDLRRMEATVADRILSRVARGELPVVGGFVGRSPDGITTTLGRGGGDTTAALVGAAGRAEELQIWTDVDGLMTADPRMAPDAALLDRVSFAEAAEMASAGARVLHPASVSPAVAASIPVRVLNSRRPGGEGTLVLERPDPRRTGITSLASRSGMTALVLEADRAVPGTTFRERVLSSLAGGSFLPDLWQVSPVGGLALFTSEDEAGGLAGAWERLGDLRIVAGVGLVAAVGEGMRGDPALAGQVGSELAGRQPRAILAGGSPLSIWALYPDDRLGETVRELHGRFFREVIRT